MAALTLSKVQAGKIGQLLSEYIRAGNIQKGNLPDDVWKQCEKYYRNEDPPVESDRVEAIHVPFSQPRQDALTSSVCTVLSRQDPYMQATGVGDEATEEANERLVHRMWVGAGFDMQIRKGSVIATNTNRAVYRLTPIGDYAASGEQCASSAVRRRVMDWDVVHPKDFIKFPSTTGPIEDCICVGHRFYRTVGEIKGLQKSKAYFDRTVVDVTGGDDPSDHDETGAIAWSRTSLASMPPDRDAEQVELWELLVKFDPKDFEGFNKTWHHCTVAVNQEEILRLSTYPYSRPWYFFSIYKIDPLLFWSGSSVARDLSGPQCWMNKLAGLQYTGSANSALSPIIGPRTVEKYSNYHWGDYIETDDPVTPWSQNSRYDGQWIHAQMEMCQRIGDEVARISQNTLGANNASADTATENSIIAAGVQVGQEEYIANFSAEFPAMAEFTIEIALGMYEVLAKTYTKKAPVIDPMTGQPQVDPATGQPQMQDVPDIPTVDQLKASVMWEVSGKSAQSTPQAKFQAAAQFIQVAADPDYGYDKYELGKVLQQNSALAGAGGIQIPKEVLMQQKMEAQQMQMQQQQDEMAMRQQEMQTKNGSGNPKNSQPSHGGNNRAMAEDAGNGAPPPGLVEALGGLAG